MDWSMSKREAWRLDVERFGRLSRSKKRLAAEALIWLALARVVVWTIPFGWTAAALGLSPFAPDEARRAGPDAASAEGPSEDVGWAVRSVAARTPWPSSCLVQSLAAHIMLRRRGLPSDVYLGVAK